MFNNSGIVEGGTLLIHSSMSRTLKREGCGPSEVIEHILTKLGPSGTLLLPLFNFDFTKGTPFHFAKTPSQMGALAEAGRRWPANYGLHPVKGFIIDFVVAVIFPISKVVFGFFVLFGTIFALSYPAAWFWNAILADRPKVIEFFFLWCFFTVLTLFLWKVAISIINVFRTNEIMENDIKLLSISLVLGFILSGTLGFKAFLFLL